VKGRIFCRNCGKRIELDEFSSPEEAAFSHDWAKVIIKEIDREQKFFLCYECLYEIMEYVKSD